MWWCAARQSWPVLSQKFATACFLGLFLLFSHVVLMFCHCVLLDEAMASWEKFSCVFRFMSLLIVSKLSGVCFEVWFLFLPVGWWEGTHWKATLLPCLLRSFIVLLASYTVWVVACLFEATVWMADLESTRRRPFWKPLVGGVVVAVPWLLLLFLRQN